MEQSITFKFRNPIGIRIVGAGSYVKNQVEHLVDLFDFAEFDHFEEIRQEQEY